MVSSLRLTLVLLLLLPAPALAETQPLAWASKYRPIAARASDVLVWTQITADTFNSLEAKDRRHAFGCQALRTGLVLGLTEVVKHAVPRERPDGSDNRSFWSGHTATAMSASGWRVQIGVPIAIGTGYLRMAANRHYATDVLVGGAVGLIVSKVCE